MAGTSTKAQEGTEATRSGRTGAPRRQPRVSCGRDAAASRLESSNNKRNPQYTGRIILIPCRCRCRTCPDCGPRFGRRVRWKLLQRVEVFARPALFTLTVDRHNFGGPLDAFLVITAEGYIRRLMRLLKVDAWAWTLEFQMKHGDGWPHWHLIINLPPGGIDLGRAWHLWRDKWELGGLDLQRKKTHDARHAMLYATKYLTKYPDDGFPRWVLTLDRRIRWVGANKLVGALVSDGEATTASRKVTPEQAESLPLKHRPLSIRMADCRQTLNLFREYEEGGETKREFFGRLPSELVDAAGQAKSIYRPQEDEDGRRYLSANAEDFKTFANELACAAHSNRGRFDAGLMVRRRARRLRKIRGKEATHG